MGGATEIVFTEKVGLGNRPRGGRWDVPLEFDACKYILDNIFDTNFVIFITIRYLASDVASKLSLVKLRWS